jgi:hypothetical protein
VNILKRRYLQFSLRTFLVVTLIVTIWLGLHVRSARRQQAVVAAIKALGGEVVYGYQYISATGKPDPKAESWAPRWLIEALGEDFLHNVVSVSIIRDPQAGIEVTDDLLAQFDALPRLQGLYLHASGISDAGLEHLGRLSRLEFLLLWKAPSISDRGVQRLAPLTKLKWIQITDSQIGDESLRVLAGLPQLESLSCNGRFSDAGLAFLRNKTELRDLWLGGSVPDLPEYVDGSPEGYARLRAEMGFNISDDGLVHLSGLPNLETLNLQWHRITNRGLKHLTGLHKLKTLALGATAVDDVTVLQKALPNCRIHCP